MGTLAILILCHHNHSQNPVKMCPTLFYMLPAHLLNSTDEHFKYKCQSGTDTILRHTT